MIDQTLSKDQRGAVKRVDKILQAQGLPTYTQLEERLYLALTTAHEAVEMGRSLAARLKDEDQESIIGNGGAVDDEGDISP